MTSKRWKFITKPSVHNWRIIPAESFHKLPYSAPELRYMTEEFLRAAEAISWDIARKQEILLVRCQEAENE